MRKRWQRRVDPPPEPAVTPRTGDGQVAGAKPHHPSPVADADLHLHPAVIREHEIQMIQRFLSEHKDVSIEKINVNVNDRVRVVSGPLMNHEGHVLAVKTNTIKIRLSFIIFLN